MDVKHPWRGIRSFQRHSLVLMVAGLVYILIGVSYLLSTPTPSRLDALHYAVGLLDYNHWGFVFVFVGLLALVSSRWPPISETWGYQALTGLSVAWSGFYLTGVLFYGSPSSNLSGALTWGLIGFLWWGVSGLSNPSHLTRLFNDNYALREENLQLHKEIARCREERGG